MLFQIVKMTCDGRRKDKSPHSHWLKIESGQVSIPASEGFWSGGGEHFLSKDYWLRLRVVAVMAPARTANT